MDLYKISGSARELISLRREKSKTFSVGGGKCRCLSSINAVHYKDNYTDSRELWKDIDLRWDGNRITKAPYELTVDGKRVTIRNKKTNNITTVEISEIGGAPVVSNNLADSIDLKVENCHVRFTRYLYSESDPVEAKFEIIGGEPLVCRAFDADGEEVPVDSLLKDGILTEKLNPDKPVRYPVRIDPTWSVGSGNDDCGVRTTSAYFNLTRVNVLVGTHIATTDKGWGAGLRFDGVTIPNSATISAAKLTIHARVSNSVNTVNSYISAENVDNASDFSGDDYSSYMTRYGNITTKVAWDGIGTWSEDSNYDSTEIKTVIQAIVNRDGWASGQAMVIFWEDHDERSSNTNTCERNGEMYEGDSANTVILDVTYTSGDWTNIAKINGIGQANIGKFNGISKSSIGKITGIPV